MAFDADRLLRLSTEPLPDDDAAAADRSGPGRPRPGALAAVGAVRLPLA
jgi:hypothetical protein